jgi:hypothetical protein
MKQRPFFPDKICKWDADPDVILAVAFRTNNTSIYFSLVITIFDCTEWRHNSRV